MSNYRQVQNSDASVAKAIRELYDYIFTVRKDLDTLKNAPASAPTTSTAQANSSLALVLNRPLQISSGFGSPEGVTQGNTGDLYIDLTEASGKPLYIKTSGQSTTTLWSPVTV